MKKWLNIFYIMIFAIVLSLSVFPGTKTFAETVGSFDNESTDEFDEELSEFEDDSELEAGFDADTAVDVSKLKQAESRSPENQFIQFGGFFKEDLGYSYEHESDQPEYSKIRSVLNLAADLKLTKNWRVKAVWNGFFDYAYSNYGRDKFTDETLDTYESESEIRDFFVDGSFTGWLRLKFGRQIIAWGESDVDQITDLANPRDNRELGIVDLEDARIPVLSTKVSFLLGSWETNLVAIHENRPNKAPAAGSEFDPLADLRGMFTINDEEISENNADNTEYLVRVFRSFNGGDIGLVWADVYNDGYHLDFESFNATAPIKKLSVTPRHKRVQTIGLTGNIVRGSWLFKSEVARKSGAALARNQEDLIEQMTTAAILAGTIGKTYFSQETGVVETWSNKDLMLGMFGVEYSGLDDLTLNIEGNFEKIESYEDNLSSSETSGSITFRASYSALNDRFNTIVYWFHLTDDNGDVYRINLDYDLKDALNLSGGFIFYEASDEEALVYPFRKNDRFFTALKYSF